MSAFDWLARPDLSALLACLDRDGERARVVGGAVRNALLGEPVADYDVVTTLTPDATTARAAARGWRVVPTGIEHGTVLVVVDGTPFEVTTLREDVETDGRHAVVRFGRSFEQDALRRDFTINALSVSPDGTLHDVVGGLPDIRARHVRFIGEPARRIAEDYLRVLRLFRFHARYGRGPLDREGLDAAIRARAGLGRLSRERVQAETLKLLAAPGAAAVLAEVEGAGFLPWITGGVLRPGALARLAEAEAARGLPPDPVRRLGAATLFVREDAARVADLLRLSNQDARRLEMMALAVEAGAPIPTDVRALLYRLGRDGARDALLLAWAHGRDSAAATAAVDAVEALPVPVLPFGGAEAARLGLRPGPGMGRALAEATRLWLAAGLPEGEAALGLLAAVVQAGSTGPDTPSNAPSASSRTSRRAGSTGPGKAS